MARGRMFAAKWSVSDPRPRRVNAWSGGGKERAKTIVQAFVDDARVSEAIRTCRTDRSRDLKRAAG